jgi:phosphatidylserine/phosphatidylglycerophosphate/cardiolipin synthase-like enzyme
MSLSAVATSELESLRQNILRGVLECPLSPDRPAMATLASQAPELFGPDRTAMLALLGAVLEERQRPRPLLELVWTGPDAKASRSRDTAVVVRDLFSAAQRSVLMAGYAFDHGDQILKPLHEAMRDRGVSAELFLDIPRADRAEAVDDHVMRFVDRFIQANWPFGSPEPRIYYDPRTVWGDQYASLHAKCVVVDEQLTLVGSANFTGRGQARNIEVGVRIEDGPFAEALLRQWRQAVQQALLVRAR